MPFTDGINCWAPWVPGTITTESISTYNTMVTGYGEA